MRILIYHASCLLLATATQSAETKSSKVSITYTVQKSNGCKINLLNESDVIYETGNPYRNYDKCEAEFSCSENRVIRYWIDRFEIEKQSQCKKDSLGLYITETGLFLCCVDYATFSLYN